MNFFDITSTSSTCRARTGIIHTDHGDIETPIFMPVGTQATVKALNSKDLHEIDAQIILANTYHLHLRPGEDLIADHGGLHNFMKWDGPMLTDSGGFQVFSLGKQKEQKESSSVGKQDTNHGSLVDIDDEGVTFRSHLDGSKHRFTPASAIETQHKLGADIIMAFDECTPDTATREETKRAMDRTHRWAQTCIDAHKQNTAYHGYRQFLFGIIQGSQYEDLRIESAKTISAMDFDGIAIGGESIGYNMDATADILDWVMPHIPEHKPHYTMGLGHSPRDFFAVVERGIDMFDCVSPTRMARNGTLFVHPSISPNCRINITNKAFREDKLPIDPLFERSPVGEYSRAYVHHLFQTREILAYRIATMHNLAFLLTLMEDMRTAIKEDRFEALKADWM
jgi:tRNA-guanine transglycosylase